MDYRFEIVHRFSVASCSLNDIDLLVFVSTVASSSLTLDEILTVALELMEADDVAHNRPLNPPIELYLKFILAPVLELSVSSHGPSIGVLW
jgi:hypothetical protein